LKMSLTASAFSVKSALEKMELTEAFKTFVTGNRELWSTFGKMDSHLYREKLMKLMNTAGLSAEQKLIVYFFFAVVKKKSRVIEGMNSLPDAQKNATWFSPVMTFVAGTMTDYNSQAKNPDKFPGTHVPTTNPGLDLLMWRLMTDPKDRNKENFFRRTTSTQLHLDTEMQAMAKSGYKFYWDSVVTGTKNSMSVEAPQHREAYYDTSAGDKYFLLTDTMKEIKPKSMEMGYTEKEISDWIATGP